MKQRFIYILIALVIAFQTGWSQEKSLLWSISGNGLTSTSYVYGTIHLINAADFFLTPATTDAFRAAERVTFEIDLEEMSDIGLMTSALMQAFMKNDTTLQDLLSPADFLVVKKHFAPSGLPMFVLNRIKPLFLSAFDPSMFEKNGSGAAEEMVSYEMKLAAMAKEQGKPTDGLETTAFQLSLFDSIPYRDQATILLNSIQLESDQESDTMAKLTALYKSQDILALQQLAASGQTPSDFERQLIINRNQNWIAPMKIRMAEKPTFFAVGAGHLGGPNGILQLLRNAGYTVTPLY